MLMRILAVVGFVILLVLIGGFVFVRIKAPHLVVFSKGIQELTCRVELDSLQHARFIDGMNGCENLWLEEEGMGFYVSTLDGKIHYLDGPSLDSIRIVKSFEAGSVVTGITALSDTTIAAVVCSHSREEWMSIGAAVNLFSKSLVQAQKLTADFPAANGICMDSDGNIYFASSNFSFFSPEGNIYFMARLPDGRWERPEALFDNAGLANGLFYDTLQDRIYFSNTIGGVYSFTPGDRKYREEYLKLKFMEACDDLCTDPAGNIWMTDPGYSTVKLFNPGTNRLVRFTIHGLGQTSSIRLRNDHGEPMLYITELKKKQKPVSQVFDGRGVLVVPARDLLSLIVLPEASAR